MSNVPDGAQLSDDGNYWWDGSIWQPVNSSQIGDPNAPQQTDVWYLYCSRHCGPDGGCYGPYRSTQQKADNDRDLHLSNYDGKVREYHADGSSVMTTQGTPADGATMGRCTCPDGRLGEDAEIPPDQENA